MEKMKNKIIDERFEGLELSEDVSKFSLEEHARHYLCNGVPKAIWGLDITPAVTILYIDYIASLRHQSDDEIMFNKKIAEIRFKKNVLTLILRADKKSFLRRIGLGFLQEKLTDMRKRKARLYYYLLRFAGDESFLSIKKHLCKKTFPLTL